MNYKEIDVQGQVVYVEPTWVTGETCLFYIKDPIVYARAKSKLLKLRKDFLARLEKEGFVITYDKADIKNGAVCLVMDDLAICDESVEHKTYKKKFDQRIFQAGGDKLNYPYSLTVEDYFVNPFFPAVFKNEAVNGGVDKFFIETVEQVEIIKKLYNKFLTDKKYHDVFENCIFQQFIETPTKCQTYMRILMAASGEVLGASLKYSRIGVQRKTPKGIFEQYFWDRESEYFLDCEGMFNYYSEGGSISFSQPKYSSEKQEILKAHGINSDCPAIPSDVMEVASQIAQSCNRELGIICGIDFILNEEDNKWYYLEIQAFPAIDEWAIAKDIRINKVKSVDDYIKYLQLEMETRYEALMMYVEKKLSYSDSQKRDIKTYGRILK